MGGGVGATDMRLQPAQVIRPVETDQDADGDEKRKEELDRQDVSNAPFRIVVTGAPEDQQRRLAAEELLPQCPGFDPTPILFAIPCALLVYFAYCKVFPDVRVRRTSYIRKRAAIKFRN